MATPTYASLQGNKSLNDLWIQFLQTFLSGQNNDASAYTLPVAGTITNTPPSVAGNAAGTAVTASAVGANSVATATLAAAAGKFTWITGFTCTASGAVAGLPVVVTITGIVTGTMSFVFTYPAGVLVPATPLVVSFPTPVPTSAVNTAISVGLPAGGAGNTNSAVNATGFQL